MAVVVILAALALNLVRGGIRLSREARAQAEIEQLVQDALGVRRRTGQWPPELPARYAADPWGRPYDYDPPTPIVQRREVGGHSTVRLDGPITIRSAGPDGVLFSPDDLHVSHP